MHGKTHKYEGMRRTNWCAVLAALPVLGQGAPWPTQVSTRSGSQAMSEDAVQRSRWTFYEVVNIVDHNTPHRS